MFRQTAHQISVATALALLSTLPAGQIFAQKSGEVSFGDENPGKRVRVSVDVAAGYDDNIFTSATDEEESFFTTLGADVSVNLGNTRTNVDLFLGGSATWYPDREGDDFDYSMRFGANAFHDLNERFDLFGNVNVAYEVEPDYGDIFSTNRRDGDYFYTNIGAGVNSQWTQRFSTVTSLNYVTVNYLDDEFSDSFDRQEYGFSNAFRFALKPETFLVAEYRFRMYDHEDGSRDAMSHYLLAGVDHTFTQRLNANFRAGAEIRDFDSVGEQTAPYFESTVSYLGPNRSTISWISRVGYEVSDTVSYDERFTYRTGVSWVQGITPRLRSNVGLFYQHNEFTGNADTDADFEEDVFSLSAGLTYALNRHMQLNVGYSYSTVGSDEEFREYDRNVYSAGLRFVF